MLLPLFFKILLFLLFQPADLVRIDLGGGNQSEWTFYSRLVNISGKARVPGDIFADLQANHLIGDPLYGDGDLLYRWVGHQDWTYQRPIRLPMEAHNATFLLLHFHGLDGPCSIQINGRHLATVDNQFRSHTFDAKPFLTLGLNFLAIDFQSPVNAAKAKAENYRMLNLHALPPECPPPVQHGECHVNQLRKMQASFSWDWGPSLPGVGIWRPVELQYFDNLSILRWSPVVLPGGDAHFLINASLSLLCSPAIPQIGVELSLPQLGLAKHFQIQLNAGACHPRLELGSLQLLVPRHKVQLWWPRGYGRQPLYRLQLVVTGPNGQVLDKAHKRIAFRTVQLNQTPLNSSDPTRGRLFQFEVNGKPVFLKGTNWAPISAFAGRQHSRRRRFLFHSMVAANMNALRVWGGGFYEEEEFYDLADRLGLLIWQDFMFACALYPTDAAFLRSVQAEVEEQVLRLRHHPSVLCWAGNNENELAIRSHWYPEPNYPEEAQARDYLVLYKASIQPLVRALDPSRPFLLSSPSNGAETERQGGIARKPGDPAFGDIHFYTEAENLWQDSTFPVPRCASEFGTQSIPMRATMLRWLPEADWSYGSRAMVRRQHHPGGILSLPAMALQHFPLPLSTGNFTANSSLVDQLAFLTQAHQAIALQAQIEHYRRWRSRLADGTAGLGRTMCALYWQLNDVWAAPSWSTVDFDLRWKLGHNQVRRSFAPLIVSMFLDTSASADGQLRLFVVSDLLDSKREVNIQLDVFVLRMDFRPIFSERIPLTEVPAQTAFEVPIPVLGRLPHFGQSAANEEEYLVAATLLDAQSGQPLSPKAILLPDKLRHTGKYGTAKLTHFAKIKTGSEDFELTVEADGILPLVWLQLGDQFTQAHPEVLYHFEENAFAMASPEQNATLRLFSNPRGASIEAGDIQILLL